MILAGHKPYLWPYTLPRAEAFVPGDADVCIVSPGVAPPELDHLAQRRGWSWLTTGRNALCLAQNLAIADHPAARWIHKIDEDVFVAEGHFERMSAGYRAFADEGRFTPGYAAPVLNVNGFSYLPFLEELGLVEDWRQRFGDLRQACMHVPAQVDPVAAEWLWERSLPFDEVAARFAARPFGYTTVPQRFSIGAFLLERGVWEAMGGFPSHPIRDVGEDERALCQECADRSLVPFVLHDVFAGHWSFGPQEAAMRAALPRFADVLRPPASVLADAAR